LLKFLAFGNILFMMKGNFIPASSLGIMTDAERLAIVTENESVKPFYLDNTETKEALELELGVLSPELKEAYRVIEDTVSTQFLSDYKQFLNPQQITYFEGRQMIVTSHEMASGFGHIWEKKIKTVDHKVSAIDGKVYLSYRTGEKKLDADSTRTAVGGVVQQYWAGRFALYPLETNELYKLDKKFLMSDADFQKYSDTLDMSGAFGAIPYFIFTNVFGNVSVHEKVHGIQDFELPLPILEAAANYYQRTVGVKNNWNVQIGNNMEKLADLYEEFIKEHGEDVHRLMFGNIEAKGRKAELLTLIKEKFSNEAIETASKWQENDWWEASWRKISWEIIDETEA
jgi:hypothetical protein